MTQQHSRKLLTVGAALFAGAAVLLILIGWASDSASLRGAVPALATVTTVLAGLVFWTAARVVQSEALRDAATRALRASEERYRALTEALPHMVWAMTPDRALEFLNRSASEFTGLTVAEVNATGWPALIHPDDRAGMLAAVAGPLERGEPHGAEYRFRHHTGEFRWVVSRTVPIKGPDGAVAQWVGSTVDVHDRRTAEDRVRASERRLRAVIQANPQIVWTTGENGAEAAEWWAALTGQTPEESGGLGWLDAVHPDDRERVRATWARARETHDLYDSEYRIRTRFGEYRHFAARGIILRGAGGEVEEWVGTIADIHERKGAEEHLREFSATLEQRVNERTRALEASEQRFRAIFHSQFQFIGLLAPDGVLLEANRAALAAAGVSEADVVGRPFWETAWWVGSAEQQERLKAAVRRAAGGERARFEASHPTADGGVIWVDFSLTPFRDPGGDVVLLIPEGRDITERKRVEAELRLSEEQFREFLDHLPLAAWAADSAGRFVIANRFLAAMLGRDPGAVIDKTRHDLLAAADAREHEAVDRQVLESGREIEREETYERPDGTRTTTFTVKFPVHAADGTTVVGGVALDITARKQAEAALQLSEERFRSAFDHAPIGMALVSPDGRWLRVNRSVCDIVGYPEPELLASDFQTITHPDDLTTDLELVRRVLAGAVPTYQMEKRYVHKRGHIVHVLLSVSLVRDEGGAPLYFISQIQDITERKEAERRLTASLREKEVLLKEIHHRVKNNLQIVSALLDLQSDFTTDAGALEMFKESRGRVRSMALIHERLYRSADVARVNFAEYVRQLADDLYRAYRVSDGVQFELDVDVPPLPIDIAIPCGLLLNELMSNCFKHAFQDATAGVLRVSLTGDGDESVLVVADNGVGFPDGLDFRNTASFGLQLVNTLVAQLGGAIELASGHGTAFTVRFAAR